MNANDPARIATPPSWSEESDLDEDRSAVVHYRMGDTSFCASSDRLEAPHVTQALRLDQVDRLILIREGEANVVTGLASAREPAEIVLVEFDGGKQVELTSWPVQQARALRVALGELLDAYDTTGGE